MWFLFVLAVVVLLFLFPRQMSVVLGAAAVIGVVIGIWYYLKHKQYAQEEAAVQISVLYDPRQCSPEQPLLVTIRNQASLPVVGVEWVFSARRPGYRSELTGDWLRVFSIEEVIAPGQARESCHPVPQKSVHVVQRSADDPANLQIGIRSRQVRFAE